MFSTCSDDLRWLLDDYCLYILVIIWPNRDTTRKKTCRSAHLQLSQTTNRRGLQRWHSQPETVSRSPPHIKKSQSTSISIHPWFLLICLLQHLATSCNILNTENCSEIWLCFWTVKSGQRLSKKSDIWPLPAGLSPIRNTRIDPRRILLQLPLSCIALEEAYVLGSDGHGSEASVPVHHFGLGWSNGWLGWLGSRAQYSYVLCDTQ